MTARLKPVLAVREGNRDVLYVEPVRIVVRAASEDGTGYPATYIEIAPDPMDAAPAEATDPAEVAPPAAVPLDGEYLDLRLVREAGDAVRPVTFERMMHDRRVREAVLAALGQEPPWGPFFDDPTAPMNAVQQREALARFTDWTRARAEVLPEEVYVTTRDDDAAYRSAYDLSRAFSAPQLSYQGSAGLLFESCPPTVWASVGEDRERILHLRIWSLDLALLHEVAQMAELTTKADGDRGSRELIDQAADIDL